MSFQQNDILTWTRGSLSNPKHVTCQFIKLSSNINKAIVGVLDEHGEIKISVVPLESLKKTKVK